MEYKTLTFSGPSHRLSVPGMFTLERGQSLDIPSVLADALIRANPNLNLTAMPSMAGEPARHAGKQEWLAYAAKLGIQTDGLTRDEIIAAVDAAAASPSAPADGEPEAHDEGEGHDTNDQEE